MISHADARFYASRWSKGKGPLERFVETGEIQSDLAGFIVGILFKHPHRYDVAELLGYVDRRAFNHQHQPVDGWAAYPKDTEHARTDPRGETPAAHAGRRQPPHRPGHPRKRRGR